MALTVENGTGLTNADSYVTVAEFKAHAAGRGVEAIADLTDDECEPPLRSAFDYVNNYGVWKSSPVNNDQSGEFPRTDLSDGMGRIFNTVPGRVKMAQMEAAILKAGGVDLTVVAERSGGIASEAVGPISTSYFQGSSPKTYFEAIDSFLQPFIREGSEPRSPVPYFNDYDGSDPIFSVGMDDNTGSLG